MRTSKQPGTVSMMNKNNYYLIRMIFETTAIKIAVVFETTVIEITVVLAMNHIEPGK
jgi:hypothetical protein